MTARFSLSPDRPISGSRGQALDYEKLGQHISPLNSGALKGPITRCWSPEKSCCT